MKIADFEDYPGSINFFSVLEEIAQDWMEAFDNAGHPGHPHEVYLLWEDGTPAFDSRLLNTSH